MLITIIVYIIFMSYLSITALYERYLMDKGML